MALKFILALVGTIFFLPNLAFSYGGIEKHFLGKGDEQALYALAARVLDVEEHCVRKRFTLLIDRRREKLGFQLFDGPDGKVWIQGSSGPDVAYGLGHYLREKYHISMSWNRTGGKVLNPEFWDDPRRVGASADFPVQFDRRTPISYFSNVVTFSYSFVWYTFAEWEYLLDWMALSGINLMIAYTGQEEIYRKTFKHFGVDDETFQSWCNGIAYLAWARGQNLHGCSDPISLKVMHSQWELQKQILGRMREIGMIPILPAFQGNVPGSFRSIFPNANISKSGIAWIDGTDKLFKNIQSVFLRTMIEDWGTDHWYETDGYFNHASEPWYSSDQASPQQVSTKNSFCRYGFDPSVSSSGPASGLPIDDEAARSHSSAVCSSIRAVDKGAVWLYQGWIWRGWGSEKMSYMQGFVDGARECNFVMLNMVDDLDFGFSKTMSTLKVQFIWSVLHNFGGNTGMWGSMLPQIDTLDTTFPPLGIGAAPEGIDQNPAYYDLLYFLNWNRIDSVHEFLDSYTVNRYGFDSSQAKMAWRLLQSSVYDIDANRKLIERLNWLAEKNSDGITALAHGGSMNTPGQLWYDQELTKEAWRLLVKAGEERNGRIPSTLNYDIVNVGREVLAKESSKYFWKMTKEGASRDEVESAAKLLIEITQDVDLLLCTEASFMSRTWFDMAARLAASIDPNDLALKESFLFQARAQVTTWGPQPRDSIKPESTNLDYGNKQWGGSLSGFYASRHACYLNNFDDLTSFHSCVANVSYEWTHDIHYEKFPMCATPSGSSVQISRKLIARWLPNDDTDPQALA